MRVGKLAIAVLDAGRLLQVGSPRELLHAPADARVAELLETPRRQVALLESLLDAAHGGRA